MEADAVAGAGTGIVMLLLVIGLCQVTEWIERHREREYQETCLRIREHLADKWRSGRWSG